MTVKSFVSESENFSPNTAGAWSESSVVYDLLNASRVVFEVAWAFSAAPSSFFVRIYGSNDEALVSGTLIVPASWGAGDVSVVSSVVVANGVAAGRVVIGAERFSRFVRCDVDGSTNATAFSGGLTINTFAK